jgi:hypothetical protein
MNVGESGKRGLLTQTAGPMRQCCDDEKDDVTEGGRDVIMHGYATKEGCRTERKSRNLEYAMGVRLAGCTT